MKRNPPGNVELLFGNVERIVEVADVILRIQSVIVHQIRPELLVNSVDFKQF